MQAAIYTRLSLERDANADNCAIQEVECREYAEGLGWEVVAVFSDSDIDSEELAAALRDSTRPEISGLMETYDSQRTKLNDLICRLRQWPAEPRAARPGQGSCRRSNGSNQGQARQGRERSGPHLASCWRIRPASLGAQ
jgi:hypothetical protein